LRQEVPLVLIGEQRRYLALGVLANGGGLLQHDGGFLLDLVTRILACHLPGKGHQQGEADKERAEHNQVEFRLQSQDVASLLASSAVRCPVIGACTSCCQRRIAARVSVPKTPSVSES